MIEKKLKLTKSEFSTMRKVRKGSKLLVYKDEILFLHLRNVANSEIVKWLLTKNISVSQENVRQFCKRYIHEYDDVKFLFKRASQE